MLLIGKILKYIGLDKAVSVTLLARIWTIFGGLGTLFFITRYLSPELQGYYYTFNSLISLQVFVELGLNFAIIQFASHEMAKLRWDSDGKLAGDLQCKRRLQSLIQFAFVWYGMAALLVLILLLPAGIFFLRTAESQGGSIHAEWAWVLVAFFTAILLLINAALAILEGCNKVAEVATLRFAQTLGSSVVIWAALANNAGLYALSAGTCLIALVGAITLYARYREFFRDLWCLGTNLPGLNWKGEIWPFQWRIAVSWASGYLIFQLFTPLLFATHGPVAAGRMGMSMQIISAMNSLAMIWITSKAPLFGQLIAKRNRVKLDSIFKTALMQSFTILFLGLLVFFGVLLWFQGNYPTYAARILPASYFAVLCIACLANHIVFAEAAYLRAHKEEPFMILSVVSGISTGLLAFFLVRPFSYAGAVAAYSFGAIIIGLLGGSIVFYQRYKIWSVG